MDGPVHLPLFERLESELAERHRVAAVLDRARKLRETYNIDGTPKKSVEDPQR